jgi:two-component system sensor histidine kinase VicK
VHVLLDTTSEDKFIRSRDQFMMHAAHELRAPLAKFKIAIELLTEAYQQKDWELLRSLLGNMGRTVTYFQFFVENLIDIGNVQAGYFRVRPYQTEFKKIVHTALDQIQPFVPTEGKEIELHQNLPDPCMVLADPPRVAQVIFNLLSNAIKYGGEGKPILFSTFVREGQAIVEVTDYGAGIAPEEINLIFTRFYRGKRVESEGIGIGLGLAIAREIIEQHGGEIHAQSRMGEGTTFWFSVPLVS